MASITKQPNGKWRAFVRPGPGQRATQVFERKADAQRWARQLEEKIDRGIYLDHRQAKMSFGAFVRDDWLPSRTWRPLTSEQATGHLRNWILPAFEDRPLRSIKKTEVQKFVNGLSGEPLAPGTIRLIHRRLHSIFASAVDDRIIEHNPASKVKLPTVEKRTDLVPITTDDFHKLIGSASPDWFVAFLWIAALTGLRSGEIIGLTTEAIDFDTGTLRVDRQLVTMTTSETFLTDPKTEASLREVPIPDRLCIELQRFMAKHEAFSIEDSAGNKEQRRHLILTNTYGRPVMRSSIQQRWKDAVQRSGIETSARGPHALRHYYASLLIEDGASPPTVQKLLGHSDLQETLKTYSHSWPESSEQAVERLNRRFAT